jgi:quercetin dioxygenase-like cupin family protein
MNYTHMYTGPDGLSYFEDVEVAYLPGQARQLSSPMAALGVHFGLTPAGSGQDWHPVHRRQLVIVLDGAIEIEASGGETRRFGPGTVLLAEDTTGKGHIDRSAASGDGHYVVVPLAG